MVLRRAALIAATLVAGVAIAPAAAEAAPAVSSYSTTINGDQTDVYYPVRKDRAPVVLLLQGANVDKSAYSNFASALASYGFVVAVPNHARSLGPVTGLYPDALQANWTVSWAAAENARTGSPVKGRIDTGTLLLTGHSFGGAAGLGISTGLSTPPFTDVPVAAPAELKAAAFYGANYNIPVANIVPVALIQGSADGIGLPAKGLATYEAMLGRPRLYVSVTGANHYGITNAQNPAGAVPDASPQTLAQATGTTTIARWTAYWLRAQLGDPVGQAWVNGVGDLVDQNVQTRKD
ncbi:chlorophyllase/cutinase-like alpha/beta fold protein [Actinoplanes sp. CA-131856]